MKLLLALGFLVTATLYASVGFGGGSTYTAILAVSGISLAVVPIISLACNLVVVSGNTVNYARRGHVPWRRLGPILAASVPAAWLGGRLVVSEPLFLGLLWTALLAAGVRMIAGAPAPDVTSASPRWYVGSIIGGAIGLLSGVVGIGGGIFLAPLLYRLRWGRGHEVAAACSVFILMNSASGLIGQMQKLHAARTIGWDLFLPFWPLLVAVGVGGAVGNRLSLSFLSADRLRRITGVLVLIVALRLAYRWLTIIG